MTVRKTYDLFCDYCGSWIHCFVTAINKSLATKARRHGAKGGWHYIYTKEGYRDICPDCYSKLNDVR